MSEAIVPYIASSSVRLEIVNVSYNLRTSMVTSDTVGDESNEWYRAVWLDVTNMTFTALVICYDLPSVTITWTNRSAIYDGNTIYGRWFVDSSIKCINGTSLPQTSTLVGSCSISLPATRVYVSIPINTTDLQFIMHLYMSDYTQIASLQNISIQVGSQTNVRALCYGNF